MKTKKTTTGYVTMDLRHCTACWECIKKCPKKVIGKAGFLCHRHAAFKNAAACIACGKCIKTCPNGVFLKPDGTVSIHKVNTGMSFGIERLLPIAFAASAVTGIGLHIAGHGGNHETWHNWAIAHIAATFVWGCYRLPVTLNATYYGIEHSYPKDLPRKIGLPFPYQRSFYR
ncbi:4Fe-4S binding protein [Marseilla massiliensis]|uniref:4Fe-4S binding protein n=2 Tax=Marseilla massiliensis TaxID=1841864 RepID=A0A938WRH6_9BACT|nr:4Fe-4S binding protein [Marseilla massiliensis]